VLDSSVEKQASQSDNYLPPVQFDLNIKSQGLFPLLVMMSNLASTSLRQVSRLCAKQTPSAGLIRSSSRLINASAQRASRRGYVSESKKHNAQVNLDSAIKSEQKAFFVETGKLAENQPMSGTSVNADAMMSPIAGPFIEITFEVYS
jgi:cysteine desulfurase